MARITRVDIANHPRIGDLTIEIPAACRHLILTGPNGSGKSTTLALLVDEMVTPRRRSVRDSVAAQTEAVRKSHFTDAHMRAVKKSLDQLASILAAPGVELDWDGERETEGIAAFISSKHTFHPKRQRKPPISVDRRPKLATQSANSEFYDWLRHQFLQALLAKVDGDAEAASALDAWLTWFTEQIRVATGMPDLVLKLDRESYDLRFIEGERSWWIDEIADGHASILGILGEIVMRLDATAWKKSPASIEGVVVIDEPETHLHPELEESILPFLTGAFPGLQFILATHSPLVIASVPDAWVYDLRRREGTASAEFAGRRYGELMMAHFGIATDFDLATTRKLRQLRDLAAMDRAARDQATYQRLLGELSDVDHPIVLTELIKQLTAADGP